MINKTISGVLAALLLSSTIANAAPEDAVPEVELQTMTQSLLARDGLEIEGKTYECSLLTALFVAQSIACVNGAYVVCLSAAATLRRLRKECGTVLNVDVVLMAMPAPVSNDD